MSNVIEVWAKKGMKYGKYWRELAEYLVRWDGARWGIVDDFAGGMASSVIDRQVFSEFLLENYMFGESIITKIRDVMEDADNVDVVDYIRDYITMLDWAEDTNRLFNHFGDNIKIVSSHAGEGIRKELKEKGYVYIYLIFKDEDIKEEG